MGETGQMTISRKLWALALSGGLVCGAISRGLAGESPPDPIDAARSSVSKWVGIQQIIFKERQDWRQGKELLEARIDLVQREIDELQHRLAETRGKVAEQNSKQAEVAAKIDRAKLDSQSLGGRLGRYEGEVKRLAQQMPQHVQEKISPLIQRIPEAGRADKISVAERFQNVLGVINEVNKANSEITLVSEIRKLADGKPSEVQTVYFGLAQAFFLSAKGEAGIGRPGENGWVWEPTQATGDIQMMIEILQAKHVPKFVTLPVSIR